MTLLPAYIGPRNTKRCRAERVALMAGIMCKILGEKNLVRAMSERIKCSGMYEMKEIVEGGKGGWNRQHYNILFYALC